MNELWTLRNTAFEKTISATTPRLADKDIVHNLILRRLPTLDQPLAKAAAHHGRPIVGPSGSNPTGILKESLNTLLNPHVRNYRM